MSVGDLEVSEKILMKYFSVGERTVLWCNQWSRYHYVWKTVRSKL